MAGAEGAPKRRGRPRRSCCGEELGVEIALEEDDVSEMQDLGVSDEICGGESSAPEAVFGRNEEMIVDLTRLGAEVEVATVKKRRGRPKALGDKSSATGKMVHGFEAMEVDEERSARRKETAKARRNLNGTFATLTRPGDDQEMVGDSRQMTVGNSVPNGQSVRFRTARASPIVGSNSNLNNLQHNDDWDSGDNYDNALDICKHNASYNQVAQMNIGRSTATRIFGERMDLKS